MRIARKTKIMTTIFAIFHIMGLISSVHAILQTRTPQGAIAWVVSLNSLPIVAVPAYWVFGRSKFHGYVSTMRDTSLEKRDKIDQVTKELQPYLVEAPQTFPEYEAVKKLARLHFVRGNSAELLVDGKATFDSMAAGIEAARSYVLFQFYILRPDGIGNRFKDQLLRKAREGVSVYVLYDELGSSSLTPEWRADFTAAGIQILPFNTRQGPRNRFQLNFRNHRKIVVVDGKSTWIGGLNVGDDYVGLDPKLSPWRDTHLHIQGPAALAAQATFVSDWYWASRDFLAELSWQPQPADDNDKRVLVLASGPADPQETASLFFTNVLNLARERIWIATPYFIPDEATMVALRLALLKGIEVRIITPRLNDNWFVRHAANVYISELSGLGAKIYFYEQGFMHQKVMLVDDRLSFIGTVNFDNRSFRLNFEITGVVADGEFALKLERMLLDDQSRSTELTDYSLGEQSMWERIKASGAALLAPVL
jgi:cardiolipin synthase A/B